MNYQVSNTCSGEPLVCCDENFKIVNTMLLRVWTEMFFYSILTILTFVYKTTSHNSFGYFNQCQQSVSDFNQWQQSVSDFNQWQQSVSELSKCQQSASLMVLSRRNQLVMKSWKKWRHSNLKNLNSLFSCVLFINVYCMQPAEITRLFGNK